MMQFIMVGFESIFTDILGVFSNWLLNIDFLEIHRYSQKLMQSLFPQMLHFKINLMHYIESNCRISRFTKINALLVPSNAAVQELAYSQKLLQTCSLKCCTSKHSQRLMQSCSLKRCISRQYITAILCRIFRFTKINALLVPSNAAIQELAYSQKLMQTCSLKRCISRQ